MALLESLLVHAMSKNLLFFVVFFFLFKDGRPKDGNLFL